MFMELPMLPIAMAADVAAVAGVVLLIGIDIDIDIMLDVVPLAISMMAERWPSKLYASDWDYLLGVGDDCINARLAQGLRKQKNFSLKKVSGHT